MSLDIKLKTVLLEETWTKINSLDTVWFCSKLMEYGFNNIFEFNRDKNYIVLYEQKMSTLPAYSQKIFNTNWVKHIYFTEEEYEYLKLKYI